MAKNLEARQWGARLIREVVDRAAADGKSNSILTRMAYLGAGSLKNVSDLAAHLGYMLVIQPPEEKESGRWYAMGGKWRDQLKAMVFHFCNREDEELIADGMEDKLECVTRDSKLRRALHDFGLNAECFTYWLQKGKIPTMETFCLLAMFEGFGIEWRRVEK